MEILVNLNVCVFVIVVVICTYNGLDLKKWSSWLYGLYGLITGLLMGLMRVNFKGGLQLGLLFAFAVLYGGATTRWHKQRYKK